jgi:hypothetical protein
MPLATSNESGLARTERTRAAAGESVAARQELNWTPMSCYRLRDRRLAARIESIRPDRIRGTVFSFVKAKYLNGVPSIDSSDIECVEEWDLRGNAKGHAEHDLMELIR